MTNSISCAKTVSKSLLYLHISSRYASYILNYNCTWALSKSGSLQLFENWKTVNVPDGDMVELTMFYDLVILILNTAKFKLKKFYNFTRWANCGPFQRNPGLTGGIQSTKKETVIVVFHGTLSVELTWGYLNFVEKNKCNCLLFHWKKRRIVNGPPKGIMDRSRYILLMVRAFSKSDIDETSGSVLLFSFQWKIVIEG